MRRDKQPPRMAPPQVTPFPLGPLPLVCQPLVCSVRSALYTLKCDWASKCQRYYCISFQPNWNNPQRRRSLCRHSRGTWHRVLFQTSEAHKVPVRIWGPWFSHVDPMYLSFHTGLPEDHRRQNSSTAPNTARRTSCKAWNSSADYPTFSI